MLAQVTAIAGDCADESCISLVCARAVAENGKLDAFFANAGVLGWRKLDEIAPDQFLEIVRVNTLG